MILKLSGSKYIYYLTVPVYHKSKQGSAESSSSRSHRLVVLKVIGRLNRRRIRFHACSRGCWQGSVRCWLRASGPPCSLNMGLSLGQLTASCLALAGKPRSTREGGTHQLAVSALGALVPGPTHHVLSLVFIGSRSQGLAHTEGARTRAGEDYYWSATVRKTSVRP